MRILHIDYIHKSAQCRCNFTIVALLSPEISPKNLMIFTVVTETHSFLKKVFLFYIFNSGTAIPEYTVLLFTTHFFKTH